MLSYFRLPTPYSTAALTFVSCPQKHIRVTDCLVLLSDLLLFLPLLLLVLACYHWPTLLDLFLFVHFCARAHLSRLFLVHPSPITYCMSISPPHRDHRLFCLGKGLLPTFVVASRSFLCSLPPFRFSSSAEPSSCHTLLITKSSYTHIILCVFVAAALYYVGLQRT